MIQLDNLLDMVCNEAICAGLPEYPYCEIPEGEIPESYAGRDRDDLPPIRFNLELIENPDGSLVWLE